MTKKKTREEKIRSAYRLQNFRLKVEDSRTKKDVEEFGYLSKTYVRKDLMKTVIFSVIILTLLLLSKRFL